MKPYDVIAIGELNVDLLLNRIEGFPEIGKEKFAGDMLLTLGSRRPSSPRTPRRWVSAPGSPG